MSVDIKSPEFARGEVKTKILWGADVPEVRDLLQSKYCITGPEAETIIEEALAAQRSHIRKKAVIRLVFASVGLAVSITFFGIQRFVGFIQIGTGPILMASLGVVSLLVAAKSAFEICTGDSASTI